MRDVVIHYNTRLEQCAGYLKEGECTNGECSDCVRFVLRVAGGNLDSISSIRDYINYPYNRFNLQYSIDKAIKAFEELPFSIEVFVNEKLCLEAACIHQKLRTKLQFYSL